MPPPVMRHLASEASNLPPQLRCSAALAHHRPGPLSRNGLVSSPRRPAFIAATAVSTSGNPVIRITVVAGSASFLGELQDIEASDSGDLQVGDDERDR